jgi:hypothetical protein
MTNKLKNITIQLNSNQMEKLRLLGKKYYMSNNDIATALIVEKLDSIDFEDSD